MRAAERFDLNPDMNTLFLMGGSQGSALLNRTLKEALPDLESGNLQVLWQTGAAQIQPYAELDSPSVRVLPFIKEMEDAYALADLVVARSGALTLSEITLCGKPSVLIPLKGSTGGHQMKNARVLEKAGAARVIREDELSTAVFTKRILDLINDDQTRQDMGEKARSMATPNATEHIVNEIIHILEN